MVCTLLVEEVQNVVSVAAIWVVAPYSPATKEAKSRSQQALKAEKAVKLCRHGMQSHLKSLYLRQEISDQLCLLGILLGGK